MVDHGVAVIVDLVRSREQVDKTESRKKLKLALGRVNDAVSAVQALEPTIGDECQGLYHSVSSALIASMLLRLHLPEPLDCRFGIGEGEYEPLGIGGYGLIQDGSAWWSARRAIDEAKRREVGRHDSLRTWFVSAVNPGSYEALTNAYLLSRDQLVSSMSARHRSLLLGVVEGKSQVEIAEREAITQSAVSQGLRRSGALAVLAGLELLDAAS